MTSRERIALTLAAAKGKTRDHHSRSHSSFQFHEQGGSDRGRGGGRGRHLLHGESESGPPCLRRETARRTNALRSLGATSERRARELWPAKALGACAPSLRATQSSCVLRAPAAPPDFGQKRDARHYMRFAYSALIEIAPCAFFPPPPPVH